MRTKNKNKKLLYFITVIIAAFIFTTTIGFAFFSESLTIKGVASAVEYYQGAKLPATPIVLDLNNNRYHNTNVTKGLTFNTETWEEDTYTLNYKKSVNGNGNQTVIFTISFTNPTVLAYTEGTVTTEVVDNGGGTLKKVSTTMDKTTLNAGETALITMNLGTNVGKLYSTATAKATISYDLQGERRYLYFVVNFYNVATN